MLQEYDGFRGQWNETVSVNGGYYGSYIHNTLLVNIANSLKTILGTHLINRKVLLSSQTTGYYSSNYTWTTSYATLPSGYQITGKAAEYSNKYDDGEANYRLPLYNYMPENRNFGGYSRGIANAISGIVYYIASNGNVVYDANESNIYYPLIYIR